MTTATHTERFIPVCEPMLDGNEREYVLDCLDGNWVSSLGKYIPKFEQQFADYCQTTRGVACSSGTAALHLALEALDIGPGDEVIIPSFTLIVSANVVCWTGATPVLCDVQPDTWCIDPALIEAKITSKTKAIMPVHMYGHPADMDAIMAIANRHGLCVIEDCAQAHGAKVGDRRVGGIGHIGAFSFYGNKIITTGEGGMAITNDEAIADRMELLRNQAFERERFVHHHVGFNYRMTNIQAAIGLAQCEKLDEKIAKKQSIAATYDSLLSNCSFACGPICKPYATNVCWMYGLVLNQEFDRPASQVRDAMAERGVETRAFFVPMHRQPVYQGKHKRWPDLRGNYPISDQLAQRGFYLPSGCQLTEADQAYVVEQLRDVCR